MRLRRSALFAAVAIAASLVVGAVPAAARESAAAKAGATTYVGTVKGVGSLAIVVDKKAAFGYLCDSADVSQWFKGTNSGGKLDLESPSGATLAAAVTPKALDGVLVLPDGTSSSFKLKKATGDAGLFRATKVIDGAGYAAGWVVLPNGKVDGRVTAANLPNATVVLPTPIGAAAGAVVVGSPAPVDVTKAFPTNPPPGDQVTVVAFASNQNTDQAPGGGNTQSTDPGAVAPTTVPLPFCKSAGQLQQEIASLNASLADAPLLKLRAIKQQIGRLQAELVDAQRTPPLNCTLPLN